MAKPLSKTVVVAYGRSAVAKSGKKGALRNLHPIDMGGLVLKGVMEKIPKLDPALVEDAYASTHAKTASPALDGDVERPARKITLFDGSKPQEGQDQEDASADGQTETEPPAEPTQDPTDQNDP